MKSYHAISAFIIGASVVMVQPQLAVALSSTEVGKIAEEITVLIDNTDPTKTGSGVIIKKQGNTYTVLTAAHVIKPNLKYEIVTSNGQRYSLDQSKVKRLPDIDLALVTFTSSKNYKVAKIGNSDTIARGTVSYLGGFPGTNATVNRSIIFFTEGKVIANSRQPLNDGYALIYNNDTVKGMSGGAVLNEKGELIGIHGRGDRRYDEQTDTLAKSPFKLGIPINTFVRLSTRAGINTGLSAPPLVETVAKAEDFFAQAANKDQKKDYQGAIADYTGAIKLNSQYMEAFAARGLARAKLKDFRGAIADFSQAIKINPNLAEIYAVRGITRAELKDFRGAIADFNQALKINPNFAEIYTVRGITRHELKDFKGAIADYTQAIKINPNLAPAYNNRGIARAELKDFKRAIADVNQAIKINPNFAQAYAMRGMYRAKLKDFKGAIVDFQKAAYLYLKEGKVEEYQQALDLIQLLRQFTRAS